MVQLREYINTFSTWLDPSLSIPTFFCLCVIIALNMMSTSLTSNLAISLNTKAHMNFYTKSRIQLSTRKSLVVYVMQPIYKYIKSNLILEPKQSIFLGFKCGTQRYILYCLNSNNLFVPRNFIFYETHFPFQPFQPVTSPHPLNITIKLTRYHMNVFLNLYLTTLTFPHNTSNLEPTVVMNDDIDPPSNPLILIKSTIMVKKLGYLQYFHCNSILNTHITLTNHVAYPLSSILSYQY